MVPPVTNGKLTAVTFEPPVDGNARTVDLLLDIGLSQDEAQWRFSLNLQDLERIIAALQSAAAVIDATQPSV
jgi:hypothetical protein